MTRPPMALLATALLLSLSGFITTAAHAESEVYGGLGIGYSTVKQDDAGLEDSALAKRGFLGFRYGQYVALEAGYVDLGTAKDQVFVQEGLPSVNYSVDTTGYELALVGRYPVNSELVAFGRVGMINWDSKAEAVEVSYEASDDGSDLIWGLGLDYRGTDRISLRVEAEVVDIDFADSWWMLTTSIMYGFPMGR